MSKIPMFDPMTSEIRSPLIAGLTEACNKISGALDMKIDQFIDLELPELFISSDDRYRIYQAPLGNKLWLPYPQPIIKKNGVRIEEELDGYEINYVGGSVEFYPEYRIQQDDIITATANYIVDSSGKLDALTAEIVKLSESSGSYKKVFPTLEDLKNEYPTANPGDFAIVGGNSIYVWSEADNDWVNAVAGTDLSDYYTIDEIKELLSGKEDDITVPSDIENASDYYFSGDKTWVNLYEKILSTALTGLITDDSSPIDELDSLVVALGKLQAQINLYIPLLGNSDPTLTTVGTVGQDYINQSNGDKYHCTGITTDSGGSKTYTWEQYGNVRMFGSAEITYDKSVFGNGPHIIKITKSPYSGTVGSGGSNVAGVSSFHGRKGDVVPISGDYTAEMVGALPASTVIPSKTSQLYNDSDYLTEAEIDIKINAAVSGLGGGTGGDGSSGEVVSGVSSFNGRTGAVVPQSGDYTCEMLGAVPTSRTINGKALTSNITLSASDIGALSSDTAIPSKTSELENDSGYITSSEIGTAVEDAVADLSIPTKVSELENDSGYTDEEYVSTAISEAIDGISVEGGVASFNGRTGEVVPAEGDYTLEMLGISIATGEEISEMLNDVFSE